MQDLINKNVSAIADCGTFKNKRIRGILFFYEPTKQFLIKTDTHTISVKQKTIK